MSNNNSTGFNAKTSVPIREDEREVVTNFNIKVNYTTPEKPDNYFRIFIPKKVK